MPFTDLLDKPLGFKIPITSPKFVRDFPDVFVLGDGEYGPMVDAWLYAPVGSSTVAVDTLWQEILRLLCSLQVLLSDLDESSQLSLQPDFSAFHMNTLVIKAYAHSNAMEIHKAIAEMILRFHPSTCLQFPKHCLAIPGFATSKECISLHRIYHMDGVFGQDFVKTYSLVTLPGRVEFIVDIFKIAVWIVAQREPLEAFHLSSGVRTKTRNGHHVTLLAHGIVKEFHRNRLPTIPMAIIGKIYNASLPNVEQGLCNSTSIITITSVGRTLKDALRLGRITKKKAMQQARQAVAQLHSIGIAHCDICADNLFVNVVDNVLFLGDLEYCCLKDSVPPSALRRSDPKKATTAAELDLIQLRNLEDELALLGVGK